MPNGILIRSRVTGIQLPNWTPNGIPNGPADIATFGLSNTTNVSISANIEVNSIIFTAAATNPYTITTGLGVTLTIRGAGIINNSGMVQHFVTSGGGQFGEINFTNSATAGNSTAFINNHGTGFVGGGNTLFFDTSSAGHATFINKSGTVGGLFQGFTEFFDSSSAGNGTFTNEGSTIPNIGDPGEITFNDTSSAANATITNNGAAGGVIGGITFFNNSSTAASATIINNGDTMSGAFGSRTVFSGSSGADSATITNNGGTASGATGGQTIFGDAASADSATLIANGGINGGLGGTILFADQSTGGTARIEVFGNGNLDISFMSLRHNSERGVTVGSIEGDGNIFLGKKNLTVGSNDLSTSFAGEIQDGGRNGGTGGLLTKIGTGTLILSGASSYTGTTDVLQGTLQVDGSINSDTTVHNRGTFAGTGTVHGNVTTNNWGTVIPGGALGVPGELTIVHNYTQAQYARLMIQIAGASPGQFSALNVLGTANLSGYLKPILLDGFVPTVGESFTFLNYGALNGSLSVFNPNIANEPQHWVINYFSTYATLTVASGNVAVSDNGSTFLLMTLGLLCLAIFRRKLLRSHGNASSQDK